MSVPHRYVTPTYFSPAGYDLINVTSGGVGAGGSANADTAKVGGPNVGTYFAAFGEDATTSNLNRGLRALAQNTDFIDNLLYRDIAVAVRTADATAVGAVASVTLPTSTFLGVAGTPNTPAGYDLIFQVVDSNDNEVIDGSGARVRVNTVTLGAGDLIGGGGANGSFSGNTVQINFSPSIPNGTVYRVYYGSRSNLATMPADALTNIRIRGAQEVEADVEKLFRDLHGNSLAWDAAWTSTIYDLTLGGLDARYRRSSTASGAAPETYFPATVSTDGAGAWIGRDGPAVTAYAFDQGAYVDPINALFAVKFFDTVQGNSGGTTGFVAYGSRLAGSAITGEKTYQPGAATFLSLWGHYNTGSLHATNPYTRIPQNTSVTLTTPTVNVNTGESVVELPAGAYFRRVGTGESAIALGYDMLELQYTQAAVVKRHIVVVVAMGSSADTTNILKARVRNLDGTVPDFTGSSVATVVRWYSTTFAVGDGAPTLHKQTHGYGTADVKIDGLYFSSPQRFSGDAGDNITRVPASFVAYNTASDALRWGHFQSTQPSGPVFGGSALKGTGGIETFDAGIDINDGDLNVNNGSCTIDSSAAGSGLVATYNRDVDSDAGTVSSAGTTAFDLRQGGLRKVTMDTTGGTFSRTLSFSNVLVGQNIYVYVVHTAHANQASLAWAGAGLTHRHSPGDDQPSPGVGRELWKGKAVSATEILWTVTRY